jgi:hypothetical protein
MTTLLDNTTPSYIELFNLISTNFIDCEELIDYALASEIAPLILKYTDLTNT